MITLENFRLRHVAKPSSKISTSPVSLSETFDLSNNSCLHFITDSPSAIAIRGSNPLLRTWTQNGSTGVFVIEDTEHLSKGSRLQTISKGAIQKHFQRQSSLTKITKLERVVGRERQLLVMDYSVLGKRLIVRQGTYQFRDRFETMLKTIKQRIEVDTASRNNFITFRMPAALPAKTEFVKTQDGAFTTDMAEEWISDDQLWLRELWMYIHGNSELNAISSKENMFFSIILGDNIVTIDAKRLEEDGADNPTETRNAFYKLLDKLAELQSAVDSDALGDVTIDEDVEAGKITADEAGLRTVTKEALRVGSMTPNEVDRFVKIANQSAEIPSPTGQSLGEFSKTSMDDYNIDVGFGPNVDTRITGGVKTTSTIDNFHGAYINNVLEKHMAAVALSFNKNGYILRDYDVKEDIDATNHYKTYKMKFLPIEGKESTFEFPVPVVREDGQYTADGVKYSMDTQRIDAPLRKVSADRVAITSYYGKTFINRSDLKAHSWAEWLRTSIFNIALNSADNRVTKMKRGKNLIPKNLLPRAYMSLVASVTSFSSNGIDFWFNYMKRLDFFPESALKKERKGMVACGKRGDDIVYMKMDNILYVNNEAIGTLDQHIDIKGKIPNDMIIMKVYGKSVPLGFVMGSYYGWDRLVDMFNAKVVEYAANSRDRAGDPRDWIELVFKDKKVYVEKKNQAAAMVFSGFGSIKDQLKNYNLSDFNKKSTYTPALIDMGFSPIIAKEIELMEKYFLDPMTIDSLTAMKEPTEWKPLLQRCVELLTTDEAPDETQPSQQRLRGYERIPGMLYAQMVASIRQHELSPSKGTSKLEMNNWGLWRGMTEDSSNQLVQDSNPIHKLKQQEAITLTGGGGRSARTLTLKSRLFHPDDTGIISEATPDSAKVATRVYGTPNSKIVNTLGFMGKYDDVSDDPTSLISTSGLVLPGTHHDD